MVIKTCPGLRKQVLYHTEVYIKDRNCSELVRVKHTFQFYSLWQYPKDQTPSSTPFLSVSKLAAI